MAHGKPGFGERSAPARAVILLVLAASLVLVGLAERDLQRRPAMQVRGGRTLWRLASLNALGAAAYLRFGRRP